MEELRAWIDDYIHKSVARGRATFGFAPAKKIALDAAEAVVIGMVDEMFARLEAAGTAVPASLPGKRRRARRKLRKVEK